ncbi:MAG: hypothetical protein Ct9H90mP11_01570 [Acidimicrobiales bacterium]|nr:MAG: hypothetical protein Ct9H90mP11_01570 [Acidimicrobiales bacterium]
MPWRRWVGGQAAFTILDEQGRYVSGVNWTAPSLNAILTVYETEVTHFLNYGRPSPHARMGRSRWWATNFTANRRTCRVFSSNSFDTRTDGAEVKEGIRESVLQTSGSVPDPTEEQLKVHTIHCQRLR